MKPDAEELKVLMKDKYTWFDDAMKENLTIVGYCPEVSYCSWLFKYKDAYVLLYDMGNGYYSFNREVGRMELETLMIDHDYLKYGKFNTQEELRQLCEKSGYLFV
ncbi:MAG: hypothetical protein E7K14_01490 [Bacillota bacterium]|nr:hypothetical protein [Bacillota bacterium]